MLTVQGDVTFGENAILDVVLGPTPQETDLLVVNGHASFAGVLRFRFADGYVPPVGLAFGVVLHQTRGVNDFTLLPVGNAAALADVKYQLLTEDELVSIQVVSTTPIPEPAEWALLLAGGGLLLLRGRQRRR
jgi:outer membrane autotransporter protein